MVDPLNFRTVTRRFLEMPQYGSFSAFCFIFEGNSAVPAATAASAAALSINFHLGVPLPGGEIADDEEESERGICESPRGAEGSNAMHL